VAAGAAKRIVRDPGEARKLTARGNTLSASDKGGDRRGWGLGAIVAARVQAGVDGRQVGLFKKFAGIDCIPLS